MLRAVVLTQYLCVSDGRTDGIATASTALAMRALRRAVKRDFLVASVWNTQNIFSGFNLQSREPECTVI